MKRSSVPSVLVLASLTLTGCHHTGNAAPIGGNPGHVRGGPGSEVLAHGTITGQFRIVGGPAPGINKPLRGRIVVRDGSRTGKVVATTIVPKGGDFSVDVVPGRYYLEGFTPQVTGPGGGCAGVHQVTVTAGKTTPTKVICAVP